MKKIISATRGSSVTKQDIVYPVLIVKIITDCNQKNGHAQKNLRIAEVVSQGMYVTRVVLINLVPV